MKRITNLAILALLGLSSCTQEFTYDPTQEIKENAENIFGLIDPNQDWRTTTSGTVTVTADAPLSDIAKVQILTESPFFNGNSVILAEAEATAGQTVTLNYDAPRGAETVIAACTDDKGHYFIKAIDLSTKQVSFATKTAQTRAATRTAEAGIGVSNLTLDGSNVTRSLNANREIYAELGTNSGNSYMTNFTTSKNIAPWENNNWKNEAQWQLTSTSSISGGWNVVEGTVVRDISSSNPMLEDEAKTLKAIFDKYLSHKTNSDKSRANNLVYIREGSALRFFDNHLTSDGNPITLIPVNMASTEIDYSTLYYYYYNPSDVPSGTSLTDYVKKLPKFKAIPCEHTNTNKGVNREDFFRVHEYLLPYYGDFMPTTQTFYPQNNVYRIRNVGKTSKNQKNYLTYFNSNNHNAERLANAYEASDSKFLNQLWQVFDIGNGRYLLYNIGAKKFLTNVGKYIEDANNWEFFFTDYLPFVKEIPYTISINADETRRIKCVNTPTTFVGATNNSSNPRIASNKTTSDGEFINWAFEAYNFTGNIGALESVTLEADPTDHAAISDCIPSGYRVGFMLSKIYNPNLLQNYLKEAKNGCLYGYGEMNTTINNFPDHFSSAVTNPKYGMEPNDPRIAMFNANNKTFLAFEDGSDTNYSDMIIELGGNSGSFFDDPQEVEEQAYTMCFEDRPNVADYDMNDVVLRCTRVSSTELELSLIATGANDPVLISGIVGDYVSGTELKNKEVHGLFGVETSTFVNTVTSDDVLPSVSCVYRVDASTSIKQFLSNIYITNNGQGGRTIGLPATGEAPFALIMPGNFNYPQEKISIATAYTTFRNWVNNANNYGNWPEYYDESKIYINPYNRE